MLFNKQQPPQFYLPPPQHNQPPSNDKKPRQKSNKMNELYIMSCLTASGLLVAGSKLPILVPFSFSIMLVATVVLIGKIIFFTDEENEEKIGKIISWLEINQPDVFSRGLRDAML